METVSGGQTVRVTVKWGNSGGNVYLELQSDCDTVAAEPFFVSTVQKPSGESFEVPLFDEQNNMLWQAVPGNSNQIELTGTTALVARYTINAPAENPHILYEFQSPVDLSAFRKMDIVMRTPEPVPGSFRIDLEDVNGNVNLNDLFKINSFESDGNFHTYSYTFGQNPDGIYQPGLIVRIKVYINYGLFGKKGSGQVEIESIHLKNTTTFAGKNPVQNELKVWPNPFQDVVRIHSSQPLAGIEIFDMSGKSLFSELLNDLHTAALNLNENPSVSILKATFENGTAKNVVLIKKQ